MDEDKPVTKRELDAALAATEDKLMEAMRQIETNLLTAFHGYGKGQTARMHTFEVTSHDLQTRVGILEERVLDLETRRH